MNVLEIDALTKRYGQKTAVEDLSLAVEAGQIFGFLGPNGSGKTTTIGMIFGIIRRRTATSRYSEKAIARRSRAGAWAARKRLATWVVYLIFLTLTLIFFGSLLYSRPHGHVPGPYLGFPGAWGVVLTAGAPMASLFAAVLMALSVCGEFEWRTSRQNIIDGLSRGNWLLGKFLLIPGWSSFISFSTTS